MTTPAPESIPWYRSAVLQGIIAAAAAQVIVRLKANYQIDLTVFGVDANSLTAWVLDAISVAGAAWAAHGRIVKPLPPVTLTKAPSPPIVRPNPPGS